MVFRPRVFETRVYPSSTTPALFFLKKGLDEFDGDGKDDGGVLLGRDLRERLQVAHLQRHGLLAHQAGRVDQLLRRLKLRIRPDDFRAPDALGLRLTGHGAPDLLRQVHLLDLNGGHLDAPRIGLLVDQRLELLVECLAMGEQLV